MIDPALVTKSLQKYMLGRRSFMRMVCEIRAGAENFFKRGAESWRLEGSAYTATPATEIQSSNISAISANILICLLLLKKTGILP
jgi:hypothetical protein